MAVERPKLVEAEFGQKFAVKRRFTGEHGIELNVGDVIVAYSNDWVEKAPRLVDQRYLSQFLTEEEEKKVPVNLELAKKAKAPSETKKVKPSAVSEDEVDALAKSLA